MTARSASRGSTGSSSSDSSDSDTTRSASSSSRAASPKAKAAASKIKVTAPAPKPHQSRAPGKSSLLVSPRVPRGNDLPNRGSKLSNRGSKLSNLSNAGAAPFRMGKKKTGGKLDVPDGQKKEKQLGSKLDDKIDALLAELGSTTKNLQIESQQGSRDKLTLKAHLNEASGELKTLKASLESALDQKKIIEEELESHRSEVVILKARMDDTRRQSLQMKGEISLSKKERIDLHKEVQEAQAMNKELDSQRAQLIKELFGHRQRLSAAKQDQATTQCNLNTLIKEKKLHGDHLLSIEQSIAVMNKKINDAKLETQDAKASVAESMRMKLQLETELGKLDRERSDYRERSGIIGAEVNNRQNQLGKLGHDNNKLSIELRRMEDQNKALHKRMVQAEQQQEEMRRAMSRTEELRNQMQNRISAAVHGEQFSHEFVVGLGREEEVAVDLPETRAYMRDTASSGTKSSQGSKAKSALKATVSEPGKDGALRSPRSKGAAFSPSGSEDENRVDPKKKKGPPKKSVKVSESSYAGSDSEDSEDERF